MAAIVIPNELIHLNYRPLFFLHQTILFLAIAKEMTIFREY